MFAGVQVDLNLKFCTGIYRGMDLTKFRLRLSLITGMKLLILSLLQYKVLPFIPFLTRDTLISD